MVSRPQDLNAFEFVRIASLRAAQLMRGCRSKVVEQRTPILTAQCEVAAGMVSGSRAAAPAADRTQSLLLDVLPRVRR